MGQIQSLQSEISKPFDAIIIGSGLGGLISGALLSQAGKRVQLLERHDKFGGAATNFKRRDLKVEVSLCALDGLDDMDFKTPIFEQLGLMKTVPMVSTKHFYHLHHPQLDLDFVMPRGYDNAIETCINRFPQYEKGIRTYFQTIRHLRNIRNNTFIQSLKIGNTPLSHLAEGKLGSDEALMQVDTLWKAKKISMNRFLKSLFGEDESVKFALCANMYFFSSNLDHISIFEFALSQASYHFGVHYIQGGSQKLSDQLVSIIQNSGGEALCRREVTRILVEQGRAVGVEHQKAKAIGSSKTVSHLDPKRCYAKLILGNATPEVIKNLLPKPHDQTFIKPFKEIPSPNSFWAVYLGFDKKPSHYGVKHYAHFVYPKWLDSMQKLNESCEIMKLDPGSTIPPLMFCDYSHIDEMVSENGHCLGVMNWVDRLTNWQDLDEEAYILKKSQWLEALIDTLDQTFPGIKESIIYKEMATPRTMKSYLNDPGGGVHGYEDPELMKLGKKFHHGSTTGVDGLLLASSFAFLGPGYSKAILAGTVAAERAFKELQNI